MRRRNDPYPFPTALPFTPGSEVAGEVNALGPGVSGPPVGSPVFALVWFLERPGRSAALLEELVGHVLAGRVRAEPGERVPLTEAASAHARLGAREALGKIVLTPRRRTLTLGAPACGGATAPPHPRRSPQQATAGHSRSQQAVGPAAQRVPLVGVGGGGERVEPRAARHALVAAAL